jgi:hypothetical protein
VGGNHRDANADRTVPLGLVSPRLYGAPGIMRAITMGDNRVKNVGYAACDGCGAEILAALAAAPMV